MATVVTRNIPQIVLIDREELGTIDRIVLSTLYKTGIDESVICPHQKETIYLNKSLEYSKKLIPIINKLMEQRYFNTRTDRLYQQFTDLAGEKACNVLAGIWHDWRKERIEAEAKEEAEKVLQRVRKRRIKKNLRKRTEIIGKVFSIGFGIYDKSAKADFQKGAENAFMYGYLCALEDAEKI